MSHSSLARALALVGCVAALVPAVAVAAQPTSKQGAFFSNTKDRSGQLSLSVNGRKIIEVLATLPLSKHGKKCVGTLPKGSTVVALQLKHGVKASRSGAFSITSSHATADGKKGAKLTATGVFTSSTRARATVKASIKGCAGRRSATLKFGQAG